MFKRFFDPGGAKGGALVELPAPDVDTVDGMKSAVKALVDASNLLIAREKSGRVVTEDEWKKLDEGLRELSGKLKATEDLLRANSPTGSGAQQAFLLEKAALRLDPPDDISAAQRSYYNVASLTFEELAGLSHVSRAQQRATGVSERVVDAYSSPGALALQRAQARFHYLNDLLLMKDVLLANGANRGQRADLPARLARMQGYREWAEYERIVGEFQKAFNETTAGVGLNWVPTILSAQMMDLVQVELRVAALFPQLTMTSKVLDWPVLGADLVAYQMGEATGDASAATGTASTATTNKKPFTAQKLGVRTYASSEILEDSIVPMLEFILANTAKALARGIEDAIINGEFNAATMDGTTFNPAGDAKRVWNGLRYYNFITASYPGDVDAAGTLTSAKLLDAQLTTGAFGATPSMWAWVVGFRGMKALMKQAEVITLEKFGPNASILSGQVASIFGSPVILSEFVFDQKTTGLYGDGTARNFGSVIGVHRGAFGFATRRGISVNGSTDRHIDADQTIVVGTTRNDFQPFFTPSASVVPTCILYNFS
jgi:HK97 family phage major capsid protein